jgi:hypothetical protein
MPISFARLQEYLDLIVQNAGDNSATAPHKRFWSSYQNLTANPLLNPKCNGQPIFPVKYTDPQRTTVDADGSPMYVILTSADGFCGRGQMPPGGPFITDAGYSLTLSDGSTATGAQIAQDIHDWLAAGAPNS